MCKQLIDISYNKLPTVYIIFRSQRLQFDVSSPNGILLFREISKVIVGYGSRVLTLGDIPKDQLYPLKYPFQGNEIRYSHSNAKKKKEKKKPRVFLNKLHSQV